MRMGLGLALVLAVACSSTVDGGEALGVLPTRPSAEQQGAAAKLLTGAEWYRHAVFYEVNLRSFQDSNGDGIGDLDGLTSRLDYLKELGVDAVWLMPIFPSGFKDSGYDVADYRAIAPEYGDMAAFERLVAEAHKRSMRVFLDLVLNHTSDKHEWFAESRSSKTNPKADWYLWSDTAGRADLGNCQPDNPMFGNLWTLDEARGQYYYHRFYKEQPDLNYRNPEVVLATLDAARFWLEDKGVDGYRCDVIGKLYESPEGCSMLPETVAYIKQLRGVLNALPDKAMVAEPSEFKDSAPYFGNGSDMFHMTFDFGFGYFWGLSFASRDKRIIEDAIKVSGAYTKGAQPAQVIGSHDVFRAWQSAGTEAWRYRNATLLQMTMRGTPFLYYGEEVGLRPGSQVVVDIRDLARTPMTWTSGDPKHGFTTGAPWIAFGEAPEITSVDAQDADPKSMLTYYRQLLAFRRGHAVWGTGEMRVVPTDSQSVVAFTREDATERYAIAVNLTDEAQIAKTSEKLFEGTLVFGDGKMNGDGFELPATGAAVFKAR